jgi:peptide/nickel transport system ATP-binding protein
LTELIAARGLEVTFQGRNGRPDAKGLDGVDLDVAPGEILALVGESGCGKTTLARTMLGLEIPSGGAVEYDGQQITASRKFLLGYRRRVQLILQDPTGALNPRQSVYESVAEGIRIHKMVQVHNKAGEKVTEADLVAKALSQAGMRPPERFFLNYPHELSGGQRQRVVIAGALAVEPQVLIADEPVSSLDASIRGEILALLLKLREDLGLSVLVVTHDLGLAWNIADRIAVMYLGRIVEVGTTEEVLAAPKHPYTRALLSVVPEIGLIEPIVLEGETPDPSRVPPGCRFHPRCPALAHGEAAEAGIEKDCRTKRLPVLTAEGEHRAACWLHLPSDAD